MRNLLKQYQNLEKHILFIIAAEFCVQLINASFLLILNIYMAKEGYADYRIADFVSYRFLGVLALAFPLGLFIRGRKLKPVFYIAGWGAPVMGLLVIYSIHYHLDLLLYSSFALWGCAFSCIQITTLPFILRNAKKETQSEAISLSYATWSFSTILCGFSIWTFSSIHPFFNERTMLTAFCLIGFLATWFISKSECKELIHESNGSRMDIRGFDWSLIIRALIPTLIIAVGAGLTIPFLNLFFYSVHKMDSDTYSFWGSTAAVLVSIGALGIPAVKRKFGYKVAITLSQSIAVFALIMMASTEFYSGWNYAVFIAVLFYLIRQPLMNMAGPMTTELVMNYAGKKNQEMVSALTSAIWSGSWYISSRVFKNLRESGLSYGYIFLITAGIYVIGVTWYHLLILDFQKREKTVQV